MVVMWSTRKEPYESVIFYGRHGQAISQKATGTYQTLNNSGVVQYVHTVILKQLSPNQSYGELFAKACC